MARRYVDGDSTDDPGEGTGHSGVEGGSLVMATDQFALNELDADEFYDVCRVFRPEATREEFDREWAAFQEFKAERAKRLSTC